jgi:AAA family ATP:ADP antiporter
MGLRSNIRSIASRLFEVEPHERLKLFLLTTVFFLVISAYTIAQSLRDVFFVYMVGKEYQPLVKMLVMIVLLPAIFLYSKMVDKLRRHQLLCFFSVFFGTLGLVFAYLLGNPVIGLPNTHIGPHRIFGWIFYFFVEGYSPFLVSVFWAFANSIFSSEEAKRNYGLMVAGSKMGGLVSASLAYLIFSRAIPTEYSHITDIRLHQYVFAFSSLILLIVPTIILLLMKKVPHRYLHGYEAAYQVEKEKKRTHKESVGAFAGLRMLLEQPYVMGIFGMVYFYEVVSTILSYVRLGIAEKYAHTMSDFSSSLFLWMIPAHGVGFLISFFGVRELMQRLGIRICLMIVPLFCGTVLVYLLLDGSPYLFGMAYGLLKAVNLAFSWPVRESLYIPTTKEIKFKSKSWIDAFGSKFAKASGSAFNSISSYLSVGMIMPFHAFFFAGIIGTWFVSAYLLGRRYERAVENNEVIGLE